MEEILNKIVNLVIGAIKSADEGIQDTVARVEGEVTELIAKGDSATDENSAKVKQFVDEALAKLSEAQSNVQAQLTEAQSKVQTQTDEIYTQIKPTIDKAVAFVEDLRAKIEGGSTASTTGNQTAQTASATSGQA